MPSDEGNSVDHVIPAPAIIKFSSTSSPFKRYGGLSCSLASSLVRQMTYPSMVKVKGLPPGSAFFK